MAIALPTATPIAALAPIFNNSWFGLTNPFCGNHGSWLRWWSIFPVMINLDSVVSCWQSPPTPN